MRHESTRADRTRADPIGADPTGADPTGADPAKGGSATSRIGGALAALTLAALVAAGPATAQLARQVVILQCAVVSDPPGSAPETRWSRSAAVGTMSPVCRSAANARAGSWTYCRGSS